MNGVAEDGCRLFTLFKSEEKLNNWGKNVLLLFFFFKKHQFKSMKLKMLSTSFMALMTFSFLTGFLFKVQRLL